LIENIDDEGLLPELPGSNCCNQTFTLKIDIRKSGSGRPAVTAEIGTGPHFSGYPTYRGLGRGFWHSTETGGVKHYMNTAQRVGILLIVTASVGVIIQESIHFYRRRHFVPLALHADAIVQRGDIGIEGISKLYEARLTNYAP
jgi:hypothetical protein